MTYLFVLVVPPEFFLACLVVEDKVGQDHVLASLIHLLLKSIQFIAFRHCEIFSELALHCRQDVSKSLVSLEKFNAWRDLLCALSHCKKG